MNPLEYRHQIEKLTNQLMAGDISEGEHFEAITKLQDRMAVEMKAGRAPAIIPNLPVPVPPADAAATGAVPADPGDTTDPTPFTVPH